MKQTQNIDILDRLNIRSGFNDEAINNLQAAMQTRQYRRGETIESLSFLRENFFFVGHGSVRVYFTEDGRDLTFSFAFDTEFISIPVSLLKSDYNGPKLEFMESTTITYIPISAIHNALIQSSTPTQLAAARQTIQNILNHMQELEQRILIFQTTDAAKRYEWLLRRYPLIHARATKTQIASFLGVSRETLSRIHSRHKKAHR